MQGGTHLVHAFTQNCFFTYCHALFDYLAMLLNLRWWLFELFSTYIIMFFGH